MVEQWSILALIFKYIDHLLLPNHSLSCSSDESQFRQLNYDASD
jgi:hypothetical protein